MIKTLPNKYRMTVIALAVSSVFLPGIANAVDLATAPPGVVTPYVAPNVIVSIDDSGSMNYRLNESGSRPAANQDIITPNVSGVWDNSAARVNILKYSLKQVFEDTNLLPDGKIRLSWQSMWNNSGSPSAASVDSASMNQNSMRVLDLSHRTNFLNFVKNIAPENSTPTHRMLSQADDYMRRPLTVNSPFASVPGQTGAPYLACRRNYHIVFTDGRWNGTVSGGSQDDNSKNRTLPDRTIYGSSSPVSRPNNILYSDSYSNTLADWAFKSWADPLQTTGLTGVMRPSADYASAPGKENFGVDSAGRVAELDQYWNPKYNPATWAHMVTYTIGISNDATTWPGASSILAPSAKVPFGYDGSFPDLVTGNRAWPKMDAENKRALDLWHAALNGRGRFYSVMTGSDLEKAFRDIIGQINTQTKQSVSTGAASGSNAMQNDVGIFTASYNPEDAWSGSIKASFIKNDGTTNPAWGGANTASILDAMPLTSRVVLTWGDTVGGGVPFQWASDESRLSTSQKLLLQTSAGGGDEGATKGQQRLAYIRGDRSQEVQNGGSLRDRKSRQGDIINSEVWYVAKPSGSFSDSSYLSFVNAQKSRMPMIYVGGNDGMLHGFSGGDGSEKIAYVPRGVIPGLQLLTDSVFNKKHEYYVDGSPMTGDINTGTATSPNWKTMLVGTLGAGGRGYFVLDVTNPGTSFTETNANNLVLLDKTMHSSEIVPADCASLGSATAQAACEASKDVGFITAAPVREETNQMRTSQITKLNNNRWALVIGNGYNSVNARPVLLIQYLDGDKELLRLVATGATNSSTCTTNVLSGSSCANITDNGLSAPRLVDINGDGRPDVAYAGDNKGNMWKFLLASDNDAEWGVARWGGSAGTTANMTVVSNPLYTAKGGTQGSPNSRTLVQPISAPPTVRSNERSKTVTVAGVSQTVKVGGLMVAFGTGRNVAKLDPDDQNMQTIYSVLDNTSYKLVGTDKDRVQPCASTSDVDCKNVVKTAADLPAPVSATASGAGPLFKQGVDASSLMNSGTHDYWTVAPPSANWTMDWNTYQGWYMDLPALGERLLRPMNFYSGSNLLAVFSDIPAKGSRDDQVQTESCDVGVPTAAKQYLTLLNIMDGQRPSIPLMDANNDGMYTALDLLVNRVTLDPGPQQMVKLNGGSNGDTRIKIQDLMMRDFPEKATRPTWRQVK